MADEGPSPDPARWPTAEEWTDWFLRQDRERQLEAAAKIIERAQEAYERFLLAENSNSAVTIRVERP